jgi:hypothetical protein
MMMIIIIIIITKATVHVRPATVFGPYQLIALSTTIH